MAQKIPPPIGIATKDPVFNRWLLELTSILNDAGNIDPTSVAGLTALTITVAANAAAIAAAQGQITALQLSVAALSSTVGLQGAAITTLQGQVVTLTARGELLFGAGAPAAGLGKVNDWYGDTAGAPGARVWIKKAVGVWTAFPF